MCVHVQCMCVVSVHACVVHVCGCMSQCVCVCVRSVHTRMSLHVHPFVCISVVYGHVRVCVKRGLRPTSVG